MTPTQPDDSRESQPSDDCVSKTGACIHSGWCAAENRCIETLHEAARPAYTTGHCNERKRAGGCQLHNLHCRYPECDRKPVTQRESQAEKPAMRCHKCGLAVDAMTYWFVDGLVHHPECVSAVPAPEQQATVATSVRLADTCVKCGKPFSFLGHQKCLNNRGELVISAPAPAAEQRGAEAVLPPYEQFCRALAADFDWAWSWHCNLAVMAQDAGAPHLAANERAADFMERAFGVKVNDSDQFKDLVRRSAENEK